MKFVHIADIHFDRPFVNLSDKESLGDKRRLEQRKVFKKVIDYIKENSIPYLFISGDLYEHKYVKETTIKYIDNLFKEIPDTKVFIAPGNHDPNVKNSYYNEFKWNSNVVIFKPNIEKIETEEADIYGYGFGDFYCTDSGVDQFKIENKDKLNILVMHGTLDGASIEEKQYNSIRLSQLKECNLDYVALGHIHKLDYNSYENQRIVYPGSTISLGFDEIGKHGMIVGNLTKSKVELNFVSLDESEFIIKEIDVTEIESIESLVEKLNDLRLSDSELVEIYLIGKRNFEINIYDLNKLISNESIIKIKDKTIINYDIEKIASENTLRGIFAKKMIEKLKLADSENERNIIEKSIEIGLEALK